MMRRSASSAGSTMARSRSRAERIACGEAPPCNLQTNPPSIGGRPQRWPARFVARHVRASAKGLALMSSLWACQCPRALVGNATG